MVWLPWQCVLGRWVSSEWLSILSCFPTVAGDRLRVDWSPRSSYSDLALLGNTRTSLARGLGTAFGYSDRYLKVPKFLSICSISIYISQRPETALALFPSSVIRPPSSVGGLESEKWATDSASAISLQGLPFTSYFCHHYMVSGRAAPYIHITSSKRPHLWLRARHESSARTRNAAVRSELMKTRDEFLSDSAFGAANCFLSFSRIDNDLINRGQLRCTRFLALTFIKCSLMFVSCLIIHESF